MTAPRAPRWPPNAPTVSRRNSRRSTPSSVAENNAKNNALYEARTAKAKAKKASDELSSRLAEFQRAQSKLTYIENQRRLERDLNEGVSMAEAELLARFRREEPRSAVETLCRSLAGKNRQLARQIDEYGKLVRRVKQLERGARGRRAVGRPSRVRRARVRYRRGARRRRRVRWGKSQRGTGKCGAQPAAAGWTVPSDARGAPTTKTRGTTSSRDADDALRLRRPLRDANASKGLGSVDFSKGSFGRVAKAKGLGAFDDHGLGRVSRAAAAAAAGGKGKRARNGGASGEELLDDILSGLDLPISRAEEKVGKPTSSSSGGGDFGSFARRFGSAAAASSAAEGSGADGGRS